MSEITNGFFTNIIYPIAGLVVFILALAVPYLIWLYIKESRIGQFLGDILLFPLRKLYAKLNFNGKRKLENVLEISSIILIYAILIVGIILLNNLN